MKILHVTYDMRIGGTEMVIKNIIEGNNDIELDMSIFCIETPIGPWGQELQRNGVPVHCHERKPGFDFSLISALRNYIKTHEIDILHCHQYTPWVYGAFAAALTKTKVIFTEHGRFYPDSSSPKRRIINPVLLQVTDAVTTISNATKQALQEFEFVPTRRVSVIYNGIKPLINSTEPNRRALRDSLGILGDEKVIGTISRFDPIKNHAMLLHAFKQLFESHNNVKLLIVGDGEERENIEKVIDKLSLKNNVVLAGYQTDPTLYLSLMDIFLLPSLSEGTSMTLLEAMSLGKPCVVTDAGGNSEIVSHNETGLVTPNDNSEEFAKGISLLLSNPLLIKEMSEKATLIFNKKFGEEVMNSNYRYLYQRLTC